VGSQQGVNDVHVAAVVSAAPSQPRETESESSAHMVAQKRPERGHTNQCLVGFDLPALGCELPQHERVCIAETGIIGRGTRSTTAAGTQRRKTRRVQGVAD
jgi:hypothetical protein